MLHAPGPIQLGEIIAAPVRKIDDFGGLNSALRSHVSRFQNIQSIAVEQESVFTEQFVQFGNRGVVVGKCLDFELAHGSLELHGIQFHRSVLSIEFVEFVLQREAPRVACSLP